MHYLTFQGIVAISTNTLRILALEKLGAVFNQAAYPLDFTPRKFVLHPESATLIVIETDHNAYTEETKQSRKLQMAEEMREAAGEDEQVGLKCRDFSITDVTTNDILFEIVSQSISNTIEHKILRMFG